MAKAAKMKVRYKRIVKSLGKHWGMAVQDQVMKAAIAQARFDLRLGKYKGEDEVEVKIPVTLHITFPKRGKSIAADGGVPGCSCSWHSSGSWQICTCIGPGAADCDCPPIVA